MTKTLLSLLAGAALFIGAGTAQAGTLLADEQLDRVTAGWGFGFDWDVDLDKDIDEDIDIDTDVDLDDNVAYAGAEAYAEGYNTLAEVGTFTYTDWNDSEAAGYSLSATD